MDPNHLATDLMQCEFIFTANVDQSIGQMVSQSLPPIHHKKLSFQNKKFIRGGPHENGHGDVEEYGFQARQMEEPVFATDVKYVVGGHINEGYPVIDVIQKANDGEIMQLLMELPSIPCGWTRTHSGWVSPFPKTMTEPRWYNDQKYYAKVKCCQTRRPAMYCGEGVDLKVEQVRSGDPALQYSAPYGDGEFIVSVANISSSPIEVEALLSDQNGHISWEDSLVLIDELSSKACVFPGAATKSDLRPTILQPGEVRRTRMNVLSLKGSEEWKSGGIRVYFKLCLGNICRSSFFYYFSSRHEPMHEAQLGKPAFTPV
ncbi:hypothetical protein ACOME3_002679 [Neoechinorhynchus agilis]